MEEILTSCCASLPPALLTCNIRHVQNASEAGATACQNTNPDSPFEWILRRWRVALYVLCCLVIPVCFCSVAQPEKLTLTVFAYAGNCDPRLPASNFQVKKDGPNRGRWFYTCQKPKDDRGCRFFLWRDDAVGREKRAVWGNSRSEERPVHGTPTPRSGRSPVKDPSNHSLGDADGENSDWSRSPQDERDVARRSARTEAILPAPETPRKVVKTSNTATPGSKRKLDEQMLPTPSTGGRNLADGTDRTDEDVFTTPVSRLKGGVWDSNARFGLRSPSGTPTPTRYREGTATSEFQGDSQGVRPPANFDISDEVFEVLKDSDLDVETTASLRALLAKHALKISGIAKGRDITRVALKAKDGKIAELQQKISALEAQREMDRTVIRHFRSDTTESVERRRGRGRAKGL